MGITSNQRSHFNPSDDGSSMFHRPVKIAQAVTPITCTPKSPPGISTRELPILTEAFRRFLQPALAIAGVVPHIRPRPLPVTSFTIIYLLIVLSLDVGRDSSVGIATRYGLDGPRIEYRWGRNFSHQSRPALGPTQFPVQWVPGLFPGGKAAGAWR